MELKDSFKSKLIKYVNKENFFKTLFFKIQKFGGWLSAMTMPIIGIIIAWGLIAAFFLKHGWMPVAFIDKYLIHNMLFFLIPTLIAFNAGKLVYGTRGGFVATLVVFGIICGNQYNPGFSKDALPAPQFLGAMMIGPLAAAVLKGFDKLVEGRIKQGFEMLVNNFSLGILGMLMTTGSFFAVPYILNGISWVLMKLVNFLITNKMLFLSAIIIEPGKVFFLNNAINHGVLTPLGLEMVNQYGKSVLFLLESNPGPGLGILITTMIFDKKLRANADGASVIHFFGGVHEVYFPFVLMRMELILALLSGGIIGDAIFQIFNVGLRVPASPGSIISLIIQAQSTVSNYIWLIFGVVASTITSFFVGTLIFFLKRKKYQVQNQESLNKATQKTIALKGKKSDVLVTIKNNISSLPKLIIFACEAGMGSSAMGTSILRKKLKSAHINIDVKNYAIKELPDSAEFIITQSKLTDLAKNKIPNAIHKSINNFLDNAFYDNLVVELTLNKHNVVNLEDPNKTKTNKTVKTLQKENIEINLKAVNKQEAIIYSGQRLYQLGYVTKNYIESMLQREEAITTYMGNFLSIPHGLKDANKYIKKTGIVIHHYKKAIDFDGNPVHFIIAIAATNDYHMDIITSIAEKFINIDQVHKMLANISVNTLYEAFA